MFKLRKAMVKSNEKYTLEGIIEMGGGYFLLNLVKSNRKKEFEEEVIQVNKMYQLQRTPNHQKTLKREKLLSRAGILKPWFQKITQQKELMRPSKVQQQNQAFFFQPKHFIHRYCQFSRNPYLCKINKTNHERYFTLGSYFHQ